jgi:hypothetical protein
VRSLSGRSLSGRGGGRDHDALPDVVRIQPVCTTSPTR